MFSSFTVTGRPLTVQERTIFKPFFANIVLERARVVDGSFGGRVPFWLRRDMCAVVLGNYIYLRAGAYQANTKRGVELLGHELTHVSQFLHGMTLWRYVWSCRRGYRNSSYEIEAYAKGHMIATTYQLP
jgi:Domain of unknown function (DUF4157)